MDRRAAQVAQISVIYADARKLLIWLGEVTENSPSVFDIAAKLARVQPREDASIEPVDENEIRDIHIFRVYYPGRLWLP